MTPFCRYLILNTLKGAIMPLKPEEILDELSQTNNANNVPTNKNNYSRTQLLTAALFGINEMHDECVELLSKHSPFNKAHNTHKGNTCYR